MSDSDRARTAHPPLKTDTPAGNAVIDLRHEFESLAAKYPELYHCFVFIGDRELYDPHTVGAPEAAIELARSLCPFPGKCQVIAAGPQLGSVHFSIYLAEETVDPGSAKGALVDFKTISALASRQITLKPSTKWPFGTKWGRKILLPNSRIVGVVPTDPCIPVNTYYPSTFREARGGLTHSHPGNVLLNDPNAGNELPWLDHVYETVDSRGLGDASGYWGCSLSCGVFRASVLALRMLLLGAPSNPEIDEREFPLQRPELLESAHTARIPISTPAWDRDRSELMYEGEIVRNFRRPKNAHNAIKVLNAFQEESWPQRIDDPLDPNKLHDTLKSLNNGLARIRFRADGRGEGILWERV